MKYIIIFSLSFITTFFSAQNKRFTYEYQFIPDSTNIADVKSEMMILDTSPSQSKFYSYTVYHSDSIMRVDLEKQLATTGMMNVRSDMRKGLVRYSISKDYPDYKVFLHNQILGDQYKVSDDRKINWKIKSKKQKIGEWNTQKAETEFGGRKWIAWFASEIPIQDGPYKFHGLPGLIVKIEDVTKSHVFNLQAVKTIANIPSDIFGEKQINVNQKQYEKLLKDFENDPTKGRRQMQMGGVTMIMKDGTANQMKEQEERIKAGFKKDNNRIELIKI
ncbi:GLPGLI family protein [Chryseobacterium wangxinyae]|uniref:GLPGLI family protein n=1 Tax=Chryseobacterium sp. CY350 TaxID=2997336 RepID=UPI0022714C58|nr:GLPGLI family protein [Chryseobacterium sp. CY350]MCY0978637.1 GLPGLI family protein [Chryseobacterium sp. CY350]WBZ96406.1 GLPGLI family protein [Chryseobacterium sp. CY350]